MRKEKEMLEKLRKTINVLEKEEVSQEIYNDLNVLAMACIWSQESYEIVRKVACEIRENHIIAKGYWR